MWDNGSPDTHILIPKTCEYVTLSGKRNFLDVIRELETGTASKIIQVVSHSLKVPHEGEVERI